jgi:AcrR family transcriptional regulator
LSNNANDLSEISTLTVQVEDRRVRKTVNAIDSAFTKLFFERGLGGFSVSELIAAADIARSTFYKHYSSKEDVLCALMAPMLRPIALCAWNEEAPEPLVPISRHLWENRRKGTPIFEEPAKSALTRQLADLIETQRPPEAETPSRFVSMSLSRSAFGMLEEWQSGRHRCSPDAFAGTMHRGLLGASRAMNSATPQG